MVATSLTNSNTGVAMSSATPVVAIRRRTIDKVLVSLGAVAALVLAIAGGLLAWGSNFADDYVGRELRSQNVYFPDEAALLEEGRTDLMSHAGTQVTTGSDAEAYASYIDHHLDGIADGATYADLGKVESAAKTAVTDAKASGASADEIASLQAEADAVAAQRNTLFKGETLRGLLLSTYAWSTVGNIAGIAAGVAFAAAFVMVALVALGLVHLRRDQRHPAHA
jgi:hypothetical protein